ncbi:hypothetical protein EYF80_049239 [Liparis tanakae]|uniref:Uncharacterized protein n=1 Tax=Liparis tanakae TaxID=230148 RepID=A0A4Z2FIJ9_9TELE|nr:hypothetical protein EYF80_049239 [Liparis tanakae]
MGSSRLTCGQALPGGQAVQEARRMVQRLGTGAGCAGGLRRRQAGPLPGRLGGRPGLGESPRQRGRRGEGRGRGHLDLPRGADGGVALRVAEAVRGRGAGRSGRQADRRRLTRRLVGHGSRLANSSIMLSVATLSGRRLWSFCLRSICSMSGDGMEL